MKTAHFDALGIDVPLKDRQHFHDDGIVEDINAHRLRLLETYQLPRKKSDGNIGESVVGRCCRAYSEDGHLHVHIFYRPDSDETNLLYTRAHEETHALMLLKRLRYLKREMRKFGMYHPFWMRDKENMADVGALYALKNRGLV